MEITYLHILSMNSKWLGLAHLLNNETHIIIIPEPREPSGFLGALIPAEQCKIRDLGNSCMYVVSQSKKNSDNSVA